MVGAWWIRTLLAGGSQNLRPNLQVAPAATSRVTVLLLMMGFADVACAQDANGLPLRVFEFSYQRQMPTVPGRFDGLMASDGPRQRIAVYWMEPYVLRESTSFLRYCDVIVTTEAVHYWVYGMPQPTTIPLAGDLGVALLPREGSVEPAVRSALAILGRIEGPLDDPNLRLEVGEFFRSSRGQAEYSREVVPGEQDSDESQSGTSCDANVLNGLPYGRLYSKENRSDGSLVWRAQKAMNEQNLVTVTVTPRPSVEDNGCEGTFDPATLGRWTAVPEAYRAYWSFDRECSALSGSSDKRAVSREVCDTTAFYPDRNDVPSRVARGLDRLRFKTALMTDDPNRVQQSAQQAVRGLCQDVAIAKYQVLLELGGMAGQIEEQYPRQAKEWLRPLVRQVVGHAGGDAVTGLDRLMPTISANKWFLYGGLLLEEIRSQNLADQDTLTETASRLEAMRAARTRTPPDPNEASASVRRYTARLDDDPAKGQIDMNDLRDILEEGLAKRYTDARSQAKHKLVEDVIGSIHLIVGEGPFCGDPAALTESIDRFSGLYLDVDKTTEPIDTVLATFLALSFCDISTAQDHDVLASQFHDVCSTLESQVNAMLSRRGLGTLVTGEDAERTFQTYERIFRRSVDDPLWPAFKFPFTANEQTRLANRVKLRLVQSEGVFDEVSLKVRYGGSSAELKEKMLQEISRDAQELLPAGAFLRSPPYPGVSCQYRGRYGFTAIIAGPLYREGERPREKLRAMKYFHLGHRLENVVRQERELATRTRQAQPAASQDKETRDDESEASGGPGQVPEN
jgi:hypothetical protein